MHGFYHRNLSRPRARSIKTRSHPVAGVRETNHIPKADSPLFDTADLCGPHLRNSSAEDRRIDERWILLYPSLYVESEVPVDMIRSCILGEPHSWSQSRLSVFIQSIARSRAKSNQVPGCERETADFCLSRLPETLRSGVGKSKSVTRKWKGVIIMCGRILGNDSCQLVISSFSRCPYYITAEEFTSFHMPPDTSTWHLILLDWCFNLLRATHMRTKLC